MNLRAIGFNFAFLPAAIVTSTNAFILPHSAFIGMNSLQSNPSATANFPRHRTVSRLDLSSDADIDKLFQELEVLSSEIQKGEGGPEHTRKAIHYVEKVIEALERIDEPDSTYFLNEPLVEGPVSRRPVTTEYHDAEDFESYENPTGPEDPPAFE
mmetsp:Transcript_22239/g.32481  ORF Transcript_22239/g.32481 Transcript_22239/m.32481 type:complete len:155 (+) Transcript_22239:134-598(+)|eukprot:CAMPEP_0197245356 /NCGR_PEP_ID=MMETSP1429-20130617/10170_1 /TAXON_ID=49237 /ORGANISM="Chaetoceros  sp., Strain UNC1202" /LENGTH=154 /DNA_ID=CAMNT_0042705833 /DNA_START=118 /DNA_END=582 /DNA_ORIENTATION=+